jgi:hypothetical protein
METGVRSAGAIAVRRLAMPVAILGTVLGIGFLLFEEVGRGGHSGGPPAVILSAPAGYRMVEGGELPRTEAARRLSGLLAAAPDEARLGLHFRSDGFELFWLADRSDRAEPRLIELAAGPTGTRVETVYPGALVERLAWAAERGRLELPGAPPAEAHNLYH